MFEGRPSAKDARDRPQTPQDFTLIKTIRYEEASHGIPPIPVYLTSKPPSSAGSSGPSNAESLRNTPSSSAIALPPTLTDSKRDSGIAPSTAGDAAIQQSGQVTSVNDTPIEPLVPTIVLHDELSGTEGAAKSRQEGQGHTATTIDSPSTRKPSSSLNSFGGLQQDISSNDTRNVDLADLASDRIAFSARGSILFGGKKMHPEQPPKQNGHVSEATTSEAPAQELGEPAQDENVTAAEQPENKGLVAGRRKPSAHMLQAALQGGRVLSAEEMNFSLRVRSMYEHGDERAANTATPGPASLVGMRSMDSIATDNSTPAASVDGLAVEKTRKVPADGRIDMRSPTPNTLASYTKDSNELAGGIEDWNDIEGQDVDRYGFINQKRLSSHNSNGDQLPHGGLQRIATALRLESDKPRRNRKLRRASSSATRPTRPFSPTGQSKDPNGSIADRSSQIGRPSARRATVNPFISRERRVLTEASDIFTLPPGLAESAERNGADETTFELKQRERAREDKWQRMAKVKSQRMRSTGKGGGMRFEFDTQDQKLIDRTWKGIPDRWRATAWHSFLSTSAKKRGIGASDDELVLLFHKLQEEGSADDVQIDMDVPRTINLHVMFRRRYRGGQRLLFRVLHAISLYFPDTGYVQGMASLAATLLCYFEEERAFVMMVRLWQLRGLEQLFQPGFQGLMKALEEFEGDWLKGGDVANKMDELGITSTAYGTRWYLTLFNMSVPFPAQLRVWDVFMLLGDDSPSNEANAFGGADLDALHATSATLIDATRDIILHSDFETAMKVLTSFVPVKDEDLFMRVARAEWKLRRKRAVKA